MNSNTITLALTGASGMPYAMRLLECLFEADKHVYLVMSQAAQVVAALESDLKLPGKVENLQAFLCDLCQVDNSRLTIFGLNQWTAPIASGTGITASTIICPASMGCVSAIAAGASNNLLERAADVALKEKKQLIIVPRETPLSIIHLENLLTLAKAGATIIPASPGFYHKPNSIDDLVDFVVARILNHLQIKHQLLEPWGKG